ncbi:MAG: FAD-dependent oxidoreductase, partial [Oscillospiraceae bacterium]|nr:FAD-dependent oxidoreductase [Oscillospiraceae bacterium]
MVNLTINNKSIAVDEGKTILQTARQVGLDIPTLCEHPHLPPYGACGICVVEAQGNPKLIRACAMPVSEGMVIFTDTPRVRANRRQALELLLSDHTGDCRPPCTLACPAQTDCQGYVGLIANGEYTQARRLIMEKIPLPASIGRICPHPCEDACRRKLVENPIAIADLKRFAADAVGSMEDAADRVEDTGCSIAIVGGGPGGLSAGYFLRLAGHAVTIFDAMPQMGGMLRYGIPEYRLPKNVLQAEIDHIAGLGVELVNNRRLGADLSLGELRENYDAVILAVGAWSSSPLRCVGEELDGVLGGINFLRDTALGKHFGGKSVAVVGGGNTAMDACRTAVRLGADKVYNIYRRTINEMPAEEIEIIEAQEEGVVFKNLTNPLEILGENGKVTAIRLQIMELGEPDDSGRRAPVPVAGKEETLEVDTVIAAIGQKLQGDGLEEVAKTRWGTIIADDESFLTNLEGVFAIGDATNHGADIAITAIGEAKKAVDMVCAYLKGEELSFNPQKLVKSEKTQEDFAGEERVSRIKMPHRCA